MTTYIFDEANTPRQLALIRKKFGFVIKTLYGLRYACILAIKICNERPIQLDEINHHWQMLCFEATMGEDGFSVMDEWNGIHEHLKKVPYKMKLHIK